MKTILLLFIFILSISEKWTKELSKFCHTDDLNCTKDIKKNSSCQVKGCDNLEFSYNSYNDLDDLTLSTYLLINDSYINITSLHANWTEIHFRFSKKNQINDFCRTIYKPISEKTFYYDCDWKNSPGEDYSLEYETTLNLPSLSQPIISYKKLLFTLPHYLKPVIFSYINITQLPKISIHWDIPKNSSINNYTIIIYRENEFIEENEISSNSFYYLLTNYGNYNISIIPQCSSDEQCFDFKLPVIEYQFHFNYSLITIYLSIIFTGIILIIIIFNYKIILSFCKKDVGPYPKALLIYKSTDQLHNQIVESFAKLLKNDYSIDVIIDIFDIPVNQSPFLWCKEVLKKVDFVVFIISPHGKELGIYRNLFSAVLKQYEEHFFSFKARFINVIFPYCTLSMIPHQIKDLQTFSVNENVNKLVAFIKKKRYLKYTFSNQDHSEYLQDYKQLLKQSEYHSWKVDEEFEDIYDSKHYISPYLKKDINLANGMKKQKKFEDHEFPRNINDINLSGENYTSHEIKPLNLSKKFDLEDLTL